ncbi:MAG: transcriptional repressor [Dehalococcoidia bacterium]
MQCAKLIMIIVIIIVTPGLRLRRESKEREAIIRVLSQTTTHPSAAWIYQQVKKEVPDIGLATVYRNLRSLKEAGEVCEMHSHGGTARFDYNTKPHYHFHCDGCGRIMDLDEPVDTTVVDRVERKVGVKITRHHLELGGLCRDCLKLETDADSGA